MPRCDDLDRAVGHLFEANQQQDGAFRASKERGDTPLNLNGSLLWALETLGYGDAPQVREAWSWLLREVETRGLGARGSGGATHSWGAVKVLWAANAVPLSRRNEPLERLRRTAAASLLDAPPNQAASDPRWFRLTFPLTQAADLLQWLDVLVGAGYGGDSRLGFARSWLMSKRGAGGAWPLERVPGKFWASFGKLNEPNKWITVRALAVDR
jgi:hypothetical protein